MTRMVVMAMMAMGLGCASAPQGMAGPQAEALATKMEAATGQAAWQQLAVVSWHFAGGHEWLWDKSQGMVRLIDGDGTVLIDSWDHSGLLFDKQGASLPPDEQRMSTAWAAFINDSFWLNPVATLHNEGTRREWLLIDNRPALALHFERGGVTPGDTYLFLVDDNGLPAAWRMWVQVLPVKGAETTFSSWQDVGGAKLATVHAAMGLELKLSPVRGGPTLTDAGAAEDAFAPLVARRANR
jgi:hypothetical protein